MVTLGPITVGEVRYGTDIRVSIGALETAYHVLVPLNGFIRCQHRGSAVFAARTASASSTDFPTPASPRTTSTPPVPTRPESAYVRWNGGPR